MMICNILFILLSCLAQCKMMSALGATNASYRILVSSSNDLPLEN